MAQGAADSFSHPEGTNGTGNSNGNMNGSEAAVKLTADVLQRAERALASVRAGKCVAILDDEKREAETDLFFPAVTMQPADMRFLRTNAGGELYIAVAHNVAETFEIPYMSQILGAAAGGADDVRKADDDEVVNRVLNGKTEGVKEGSHQHGGKFRSLNCLQKGVGQMCQGSCSVAISLDHRSTKTGAPDVERSLTCRRLGELYEEVTGEKDEGEGAEGEVKRAHAAQRLGEEFHSPGHIFLCVENRKGLAVRSGHTELSVALAKRAGITPIMVGCVMLCNEGSDFGALSPENGRKWALQNNIPFLTGREIIALCSEN